MTLAVCGCGRRERIPASDRIRCYRCGGWMVDRRPPVPDTVAKAAKHAAAALAAAAERYRWAYFAAVVGVASLEAGRGAPGPSDPTGETATDDRRARLHDHVALAAVLLGRAREYALLADQALADGLRLADPRPDEHVRAAYHEPVPPTELRAEIRVAVEAKSRREARGEGGGIA